MRIGLVDLVSLVCLVPLVRLVQIGQINQATTTTHAKLAGGGLPAFDAGDEAQGQRHAADGSVETGDVLSLSPAIRRSTLM